MTRIRARVGGPQWQVMLSFVLALLFLYNPFQSSLTSSGGLSVRHPASYRATVASSELQQFRLTDKEQKAAVPDQVIAESFASFHDGANVLLLRPPEDLPIAQRILCASLWFRPPPAR